MMDVLTNLKAGVILASNRHVQNRIGQAADQPCRHRDGAGPLWPPGEVAHLPHQTKLCMSPVQASAQAASYEHRCRTEDLPSRREGKIARTLQVH